jgi:hypothetical protein
MFCEARIFKKSASAEEVRIGEHLITKCGTDKRRNDTFIQNIIPVSEYIHEKKEKLNSSNIFPKKVFRIRLCRLLFFVI